MTSAHELGPVPARVAVDAGLVRRLVADQFPEWSDLPVREVPRGGWDNWTFRLGERMSVRLPSAAEYSLAVEKEHRWLPRFAPHLPLPVPVPLRQGRPGDGYPFVWSVYGWLDGDPVSEAGVDDPVGLAHDLADFLAALQRVDTTDGPPPGTHNWFRGGPLDTYDATLRTALETLHTHVDADVVREIWSSAQAARWDGAPVWFHGDVAAGNLVVAGGRLAAVIDFGTCGVGDPSCDLAGAWTLLDPAGRGIFRERLAVDDATWARGRGWALWKSLATYAGCLGDDEAAAPARRALDAIFEEFGTGRDS